MAGIKRISKEPRPETWGCTKCGAVKPFTSEFFKPRNTSWGLHTECRRCLSAREIRRRQTNPAARETIRRWEEKNRDKVLEMRRRANKKLADYFRKYKIEWRKRNPDYARQQYLKHREKTLARHAAYRKENPQTIRAATANYRARKLAAGGSYSKSDIQSIGMAQKWKCAACRLQIKDRFEVDHIHPISRGGQNDRSNLQLLCRTCNKRKSDKEPERFMRELGYLL